MMLLFSEEKVCVIRRSTMDRSHETTGCFLVFCYKRL